MLVYRKVIFTIGYFYSGNRINNFAGNCNVCEQIFIKMPGKCFVRTKTCNIKHAIAIL